MMWKLLRPLLFCLPAELAHHFSMNCFFAAMGVGPLARRVQRRYGVADRRLEVSAFGLQFANPVGLAAGFDKDARWYPALARLGFGSIEIGTLTAEAQPGNPRPRLFRLIRDDALVNRMGFNNCGAAEAASRLGHTHRPVLVLGINIGKSGSVPLDHAPEDYCKSFRALFPFADYFTINVSSPNTPGLRELQREAELAELLTAIHRANVQLAEQHQCAPRPVLLKISPDQNRDELTSVLDVAMDRNVSGLIATNTTVGRAHLNAARAKLERIGAGGLSGRPIADRSREVVRAAYRHCGNRLPIIGVGGIFEGEDAWRMISAGASLIQIYTGFVYGGPAVVRRINQSLLEYVEANHLESVAQAVGRDA